MHTAWGVVCACVCVCVCVCGGGLIPAFFQCVHEQSLIGRCVFPVFICFQWIMHLLGRA